MWRRMNAFVLRGRLERSMSGCGHMLDLEECDILFCFNTKRMIDGEMFRESLNDEISCYMFADSEKVAQTMKSDQQLVARACAEHLYAGLYSHGADTAYRGRG